MISSCFPLLFTRPLTSLIHSALSLCTTFWDQISLQNFLLFSPLAFTSFYLLFPSIFLSKSFWLVWNNLFCTNWLFLSSFFWSLVVLALTLCFISSMTTLRPYSSHSTFFQDLVSFYSLTVCLCSIFVIVLHVFLFLQYWSISIVSTIVSFNIVSFNNFLMFTSLFSY